MEEQPHRVVRDLLSASVSEFFESYGVVCDPVEAAVEEASPAHVELGSIIGFRGKTVRGGLAFVAPLGLINDLLPVPKDPDHADTQLRDWSAEIANQLVGRLKNKLSALSVDFDVGTAVCFTGKSIRLVFLPDAEGLSLSFRAGATSVQVHLDCSIATDGIGGDVEALRIVPEGDVLLF
jgi:CheY-specific phosphatase CheX